MIIPHPDNPQHTDNLATLELLEAQGWQGADASLEISIFEYDCAWRVLPEKDEYGDDTLFLYRLTGRTGYRFERVSMNSDLDFYREFNWISAADWTEFYLSQDTCRETWDARPFTEKIYQLLGRWGYENVFGSCYWEGFTIQKS